MAKTFSFSCRVWSLNVETKFGDPRDLRHLLDILSDISFRHL